MRVCVCVCGVCARVLFFGRWVLVLGGCVLVLGGFWTGGWFLCFRWAGFWWLGFVFWVAWF